MAITKEQWIKGDTIYYEIRDNNGNMIDNIPNMKISHQWIKGDTLYSEIIESDLVRVTKSSPEDIKEKLLLDLVKQMQQCKYIEFTKQDDHFNNQILYRARIFAVPDNQIRLLREHSII